jgi:hypothetical protein
MQDVTEYLRGFRLLPAISMISFIPFNRTLGRLDPSLSQSSAGCGCIFKVECSFRLRCLGATKILHLFRVAEVIFSHVLLRGISCGEPMTPPIQCVPDSSGSIEGEELANALARFGYGLSPYLLSLVETKYATIPLNQSHQLLYSPRSTAGMTFDRFVHLLCLWCFS